MKKWYVITGILVVLSAIALTSCVPVPIGRPELEDEVARLEGEVQSISSELAQLKATKEINFGNGLRVFDLDKRYYEVGGKIQNVSSAPMGKVVIVVAFYDADGQLDEDWGSVATDIVRDLFPGEVGEWEVSFGNWTDQDVGLFDVYAIGSKR